MIAFIPETPGPPLSLGVSNIRAHSVLLQFIPGFDGKTSITLWIVEALEVEESTQYVEIYTVFTLLMLECIGLKHSSVK